MADIYLDGVKQTFAEDITITDDLVVGDDASIGDDLTVGDDLILTAGGSISSAAATDIEVVPGAGGITRFGGETTSHTLTNDGDIVVKNFEANGESFFDDDMEVTAVLQMMDGRELQFGSARDSGLQWASSQTPDTMLIALRTDTNTLLLLDRNSKGLDMANPAQTNPTIIFQCLNTKSIHGRGYIRHNNDDFDFESHRGGFTFKVSAQYAQGTMTLTGLPSNNETFDINNTTCTAKTSGASTDEFDIGADEDETIDNIVAMIAAGTEAANVKAWNGAGDTCVFEWLTAGVAGNAIVFTEALSNATVDGSGTLGTTHAGIAAFTALDLDPDGQVVVASHTHHERLASNALSVGVTAPTNDTQDQISGLGFDADAETAYALLHIPATWDGATNMTFVIHWTAESGDAIADTETVKWDLIWRSVAIGEATDNGVAATGTVTYTQSGAGTDKETFEHTVAVAYNHAEQPLTVDDLIYVTINRDVSGDTYSGKAILTAFALEYNCSRLT